MPNPQYVLVVTTEEVRVARVDKGSVQWEYIPCDIVTQPTDSAQLAADVLQELELPAGAGVALGLDAEQTLAATFVPPSRSAARRGLGMVYALEDHIPLAAEEMVADFIVAEESALGVVVARDDIRPLVDELKEQGVEIVAICPTALWALQGHTNKSDKEGDHLVVWQHAGRIELLRLCNRKLVQWRTVHTDAALVRSETIHVARESQPPQSVLTYDLEAPFVAITEQTFPAVQVEHDQRDLYDVAAIQAARQLEGSERGWIELSRDGLGAHGPSRTLQGAMRFAGLALGIFLIAFCAASLWRSARYESEADRLYRAQRDVFREVIPKGRVPVGIHTRLEREYDRLAGLTGSRAELPQIKSALLALRDAFAALPAEVRFRLLEARIEGDRISLDGEVRRHGDADLLIASLREAGFEVAPPQTDQLSTRAVAFRISAVRNTRDATESP